MPIIGTIAKVVLYRYYRLFSFQGIGNTTLSRVSSRGLDGYSITEFSRVSGNSAQLNCAIGAVACKALFTWLVTSSALPAVGVRL